MFKHHATFKYDVGKKYIKYHFFRQNDILIKFLKIHNIFSNDFNCAIYVRIHYNNI